MTKRTCLELGPGNREVPRRACFMVEERGSVTLQEPPEPAEGQPTERHRFTMNAHTGKPILGHWFWGNLVIDLAGVSVKPKIPALQDHDTDRRVGFTEKVDVVEGEGILVEGQMLKSSAAAQEILSDAADGFPWQASPQVVPMRVQLIDEGEEVEVNGHTVPGPGAVFRESVVREVSFTALGADDDTTADAFRADGARVEALFFKEDPMVKKANGGSKEQQTPPMVDLSSVDRDVLADYIRENREDFAELLSAGDGDGGEGEDEGDDGDTAAERNRVGAILRAAIPSQTDLARELIESGASLTDALSRLNADLRTKLGATSRAAMTDDGATLGHGNTDDDRGGESDDPDDWAAEFDRSRALQAEFGKGEDGRKLYLAFKRNEHRTDIFDGAGSNR